MAYPGLDSAAVIPAQAAKSAGYVVIARYINQSFTKYELDTLNNAGLVFLPIYEESGRPGSFADGQRQGRNAKALLDKLGLSDYGCAFTDDVSGASYATCKAWAQGIRSTFPNHIVYYGPNYIGDQLVDEGVVDSVWIEGAFSFSRPYPNGGNPPSAKHACGIQYPTQVSIGGVTCDKNDFFSLPWLPGNSTPSNPGTIDEEGELMAAKDEILTGVQNIVNDALNKLGGWEQDTRTVVVDGVEHQLSDNITEAGWSSRPYPFKYDDGPETYFLVPSSNSLTGVGRSWIPDTNTFGQLTKVLLNPHVITFPAAARAEHDRLYPVLNKPT